MFKKFLVALSLVSACAAGHAADSYTRYSFWFKTVGGYTSGAYADWSDGSVLNGGGTVISSFNPTWNGATMTSYAGSSLDQFTFQLSSTGAIVYTANFITNQITWIQDDVPATYGFVGAISPTGTVYGTVPQSEIDNLPSPVPVPEIDGEKLPQVALLIGGLFLGYRSRKLLKLLSGGMTQPA
jgi:hypothetical protein